MESPAISGPFAFDGLEAAAVELEEFADVFFGFGAGGTDESSGGRGRPSDAYGAGYEFEQIEGDVFIAASAKARVGKRVHPENVSWVVL